MKKCTIIPLIMLALLFSGCNQKKPAAVVNGDEISEKSLNSRLANRLREHELSGAKASKEALRAAVLEQMISEKLLLQGAKAGNITVGNEEVENEMAAAKKRLGEQGLNKYLKDNALTQDEYKETVRQNLMLNRFTESLAASGSVSDEEIKDYYKNSPTPFLKPESVQVRFIQTKTEDEAKAVIAEMKAKAIDFDTMAESMAEKKLALVSAYGWTRADFFKPAIAAALRKMKAGEYGGPFKGADGYYLLRVKERQPQSVKSFDEAKEEIRGLLLDQKRQAAVAHWVAQRKQHAGIVAR